MKATFFTAGLIASLASLVAANPYGEAMKEFEASIKKRDPQIVCIGCVNDTGCTERSDPPNCNVDSADIAADCNSYCAPTPELGCVCCDIVDGSTDYDSCDP